MQVKDFFTKENSMKNDDLSPEFTIKVTEIKALRAELEAIKKKMNPKQELYTLLEACALKGVSAGTLGNKAYSHLKPNGGKPDAIVCNRERWTWESVQKWLRQSDEELVELNKAQR
jgi:hypothetical protein